MFRELTDLTTGSEPVPIYVDRIRADLLKDRSPILLFIHPINTIQCNEKYLMRHVNSPSTAARQRRGVRLFNV